MENIKRFADFLVLFILVWLSVSDVRNRKASGRVLWLWGIWTLIWQMIAFYQAKIVPEKTEVFRLTEICAGIGVGLLFLAVSRITEEAIGYGDSIAITILGGYVGFWNIVGTLAVAFFISGVCSIVLAVRGRTKIIPFFPFLTLGYVLLLAERGGIL